jgi:hypothetical protein
VRATTPHVPREHFIPLRKADLVRILTGDTALRAGDRELFLSLCRLLESTFHFEYHQQLEDLKECYAPFDPDADTRPAGPALPDAGAGRFDELFRRLTTLLERANFRRLQRAEIEQALAITSAWGIRLDVDFDVFERLEVYSRGEIVTRREVRRAANFYRREEYEVPTYQRLVVMFRLRPHRRLSAMEEAHPVYLKIFKNIPKMDLEMLLPGGQVRMTLLDRGRILLPTLSGIALTAVKLIKGAVVLAYAGVYGLVGFLGVVGGTVGYGVRSFFGYLRTKEKYQLNLTRSLYYQNLDNNAGVLFRLLDEAEEQEFREAILAWFLLWRSAPPAGWTQAELDRHAEEFLRSATGADVDFEVHDALDKLRRLGLVVALPGERLQAVPLRDALVRLDRAWDGLFPYASADAA